MREMLFKNFVHQDTLFKVPESATPLPLNVTVRKGLKWADLSPGERILLRDVFDPNKSTVATVYEVKVIRFADLRMRPVLTGIYHDPDFRKGHRLYRHMRDCYPTFYSDEIVTVIVYHPDSEPIDGEDAAQADGK